MFRSLAFSLLMLALYGCEGSRPPLAGGGTRSEPRVLNADAVDAGAPSNVPSAVALGLGDVPADAGDAEALAESAPSAPVEPGVAPSTPPNPASAASAGPVADDAGVAAPVVDAAPAVVDSPDAAPEAPQDSGAPLGVQFTDVTLSAGIDHVHTRGPCAGCSEEVTLFTAGAAAGDFDGDGLVDLYVTVHDGRDRLYRNLGTGRFEEVGQSVGLGAVLPTSGALFTDIDNDGDQDLYLTTVGDERYYLYVNDGTGRFTEDAVARGASQRRGRGRTQGFSIAAGDYDRDGWVDLHTSAWFVTEGARPAGESVLLNNRGEGHAGHFRDRTERAGVAGVGGRWGGTYAFTSSLTDLDGDGFQDLVVAGDFGTSSINWNTGADRFVAGSTLGLFGEENGMGSAVGDFDGDGLLDWFVSGIRATGGSCGRPDFECPTGNGFFRNLGNRRLGDQADTVGVRDGGWAWGSSALDFDNDGDLDLVSTNGYELPSWGVDFRDQPMRLWQNDDGVMTEVAERAGMTERDSGRGLVVFDYDGDGDQDVFVANHASAPRLYRNDGGNSAGWLRVIPEGRVTNHDGWGVRVRMRRTTDSDWVMRELVGGSNFIGQNERVVHLGLGHDTTPVSELRVTWPASGREQVFYDVAPNQVLVVEEPAG